MINFIVAIDEKRGMANDKGIPWQGKVPADMTQFRQKTLHHPVLMGYRTYEEFPEPLGDRINFVVTRPGTKLRPGFEVVEDPVDYLKQAKEDVWVIGGAALFEQLLPYADELHITALDGDFNCTKFFPEYHQQFTQIYRGDDITQNGITYRFETWKTNKKVS